MLAWVLFAFSGLIIVLAGVRLTRDGDVIAEETGLGGAWVGAVFVAIATSLPELATDAFAVRQGENDLALGDLFGSCMVNMLILAVADLVLWRHRVLVRVAVNQALIGILAIALTGIALVSISSDFHLTFLGIGWAPLLIAGIYLGAMRVLHLNRPEPPFEAAEDLPEHHHPGTPASGLRAAILGFGAAALVILLAAPFLASSAAEIADQLGVSAGVIGVVLVAITTSLPEVTVTIVALRRGSIDMAVGNLLGSNCVNMILILPLDIVDGRGSLLEGIGGASVIAGLFAIVLMAQTLFEILNTSETRIRWLEPDAAFRVLTYAVGLYLVVQAGT